MLAQLDAGEADALVAAKFDRVSRSVLNFAGLMDRARAERKAWRGQPAKHRWTLVELDLGLDLSTPSGELVAGIMAQVALLERLIGERTRAALAVKKALGARLGRPSAVPPALVRRIRAERRRGLSLQEIADRLNEHRIGGARWHHSTIAKVLRAGMPDLPE